MVSTALVLPGQRFAGRCAWVQVGVVVVRAQIGATSGTRTFSRCVLGRILDVAFVRPQRALRLQFNAVHGVEVATAEATGQAHVERLATAFAGGAHAHVDGGAVGLLLQDEVDHAGDRVRTVDGRGTAGQHFDALDHAQRDVGDVGEVAAALERHREVGDAAAIDQHQRVIRAQAAQVHLLGARREVGAAGRLLALRLTAVLGHRAQHVGHAGEAAGADLLGADHRDRGGAFHLGARNARTGDLHRIQLLNRRGSRCLGRRGSSHAHQRQLDRPRHRLSTH